MWILFYELDQIFISRFLGPNKVAIYAIAFSFSTIFRSIFGILFSPFTVRSNHLISNLDRFNKFCREVIILTAPLVILPTISFVIIAKPFILSWVGEAYIDSISLARLLPLTFTFSFISYTLTIVLLAKEKTKDMYIVSTLQPLIYWLGIVFTYSKIGLLSFGIFKLVATYISELYCLHLLIKHLSISFKEFLKMVCPTFFSAIVLMSLLAYLSNNYLPIHKSKINLIIVLFANLICIFISFIIQYISSNFFRLTINNILDRIRINIFTISNKS
jgi:O-antigen/teichoic acid export membrane protein